jgi:hypothetical protein
MSNTQYAFVRKSRIPSREALQQSIDSLGFDLKLPMALDLLNDSGFAPCVLYGIPDVGFELLCGPIAEVFDAADEVGGIVGENDTCIAMVWRGSMKDCAAVMIVSCALSRDFGAVVSLEGEPPEPFESMVEGARGIVVEAMNEKPVRKRR